MQEWEFRHFLPFHVGPHLLFDTETQMQPSSSSWERRRWPSAAPSGPSWPLHTWAGQGPAGPGPATSGASVGSLGLARPPCNFTHFTFDRSPTLLIAQMPTYICQCIHNQNKFTIQTNTNLWRFLAPEN